MKLCANGTMGYRMEGDGAKYAPSKPCPAQAVPGHILCDACREAAGGLPKRKIPATLPAQ